MPVAEIFLSAFVQVVFDRLASRQLLEYASRQGIRPSLNKLEANLKVITKVITHAENMVFRETEVDEWLEEVRDWAYETDDFLDEVNTRAMQEEEAKSHRESTPEIVANLRDVASGFIYGTPYSKGVDELNSRLDAICERMDEMRRLMKMNLGDLSISSVLHHLTALEQLWISGWPAGLLSIQQGQGGPNPNSLPPNLRTLSINVGAGPSVAPNDEQLFSVPLPPSLTSLSISNFKKLSPEPFQNLTSLHHLHIFDCPGLTSIPDQLLLPSLRSLEIWDCPGLTSIPDQLLPPSLLSLHILECPSLAHEFAKGKGRYWPKVKFIPEVRIDRHSIFD